MKTSITPQISVILATADNAKSILRTIGYLCQQTVLHKMELVIVAPSKARLDLPSASVKGFNNLIIVECGEITSRSNANAIGIRHATAAIVALAEDHCFPLPDWAEALIKTHRLPYAAVGPVVRNANPMTIISWADFLIGYGPWIDPTPGGTVEFLPGHNSSYKRAILLEYGDRLEAMLEAETVLHWDLRKQGHELYLEPAAITLHVNFSSLIIWMWVQFYCGRIFAGSRIKVMSMSARLLYFWGSPLIPFVRL